MITCIKDDSYLEFTNDHKIVKSKEFLDWVLSLRPKDVKDRGISHNLFYYENLILFLDITLSIPWKLILKKTKNRYTKINQI